MLNVELNEIQKKNLDLKKELWAKGYSVTEVGINGMPDHLLVRCASPKEDNPENISLRTT